MIFGKFVRNIKKILKHNRIIGHWNNAYLLNQSKREIKFQFRISLPSQIHLVNFNLNLVNLDYA